MTESVWDYPRPPRVDPSTERVVVEHGGVVVADTTQSLRVLETSHPPTYYLPRSAFTDGVLQQAQKGASWCEWKGAAIYWDAVVDGRRVPAVGWSYEHPTHGYEHLRGAVAFYPSRVDAARVDDVAVRAQAGDFYGGWITPEVTGPFKGEPGTLGW